ncbi:MAG: cobyrinate a,c-diamide synthase, partial [Sarcina sp.]
MKTLIISSNCSGGGKTTVTLALMKALKNLNYSVQGYKVGPDYIDPAFHSKITGAFSRNLDIHLMGEEGVKESFSRGNGDLAIIEGVMGLYDGKGITEEGSTYHISKVLNDAPIVLVITPKAQSLTLCAEINGLKNFKKANIVGVIINCVSEKYYKLLKSAIEKNCDIKVFGYIPKDERIKLGSRHLGLIQSSEIEDLKDKIEVCAELLKENVDLESLLSSFKDVKTNKTKKVFKNIGLRTAIAYDQAFSFYYRENIEILEDLGEV